mgnify:CR=1 FL=1
MSMPLKKQSIKILEKGTNSILDKVQLHSLNATTSNEETYKFLQKQLLEGVVTMDVAFGTGQLTYRGLGSSDHTIVSGVCNKNPSKPSYCIRLVGELAFNKLTKIARLNSSNLVDLKITRMEATAFISLSSDIEAVNLVQEAAIIQSGLKSSRIKVSVTNKGYFQLGTPSSSSFCQVGVVKEQNSKRPCLYLVMKASESQAKFMALLDQRKLSLEDFLAIPLRSRFQGLVDLSLIHISQGIVR